MKLTRFTDYSLRMLIYLASVPGERATIAQIASAYQISEHHMVKVVHLLGKAGVLKNTRGKGGGVALARPAAEISIGTVVRYTEGPTLPAECFDRAGNACCIAGVCRLQTALQAAVDAFYRELDRYSLEDLKINPRVLGSRLAPAARRSV
jgi:Rrf2 family nitric oxide-sensitive transcriptional repressor